MVVMANSNNGHADYLKTTVCSMAPRHCTMFFVIITSTCSSRWRLGSWNKRKAWDEHMCLQNNTLSTQTAVSVW